MNMLGPGGRGQEAPLWGQPVPDRVGPGLATERAASPRGLKGKGGTGSVPNRGTSSRPGPRPVGTTRVGRGRVPGRGRREVRRATEARLGKPVPAVLRCAGLWGSLASTRLHCTHSPEPPTAPQALPSQAWLMSNHPATTPATGPSAGATALASKAPP